MNLRDLTLRVRAVIAPRRIERELDEELTFHLEHEIQKHLALGLSRAEARTRALAHFGSVPLTADQCRDARGTAWIDGCMRDILYAFRTFRRAPLVALTIVTTVGLGLGLVRARSACLLRPHGHECGRDGVSGANREALHVTPETSPTPR